MNKKTKFKILFIDPMRSFKINTPGIGFLRGYLERHDIKTNIINFNKLVNEEKKIILYKKLNNEIKKSFNVKFSNGYLEYHNIKNPYGYWKFVDNIKFFDEIFEKYLKIDLNTKYLGISVTFDSQFIFSLLLARYIKLKYKKNIKIIIGGSYISSIIKDAIALFEKRPTFDYVIVNQGESSLFKLLSGSRPKNIPNLFYLKRNKYKQSKNIKHIENIHHLSSPIFEQGDDITIKVTNRCYYSKCSYCSYSNSDLKFEIKDPEQVIEDVKKIIKMTNGKSKNFYFADCALPASFLEKFAELVIKNKIKSRFVAYVRFEKNLNEKVLKLAKKANFRLHFGFETSIKRISDLMNRGIEKKQALKILDICSKLGFKIIFHMMICFPTQTKKELLEDLNFLKRLLNKYNNTGLSMRPILKFFRLEIGSRVYTHPEKFFIRPADKQRPFLSPCIPYKSLKKNAVSTKEARLLYRSFYEKNIDIFGKFKDLDRFGSRKNRSKKSGNV